MSKENKVIVVSHDQNLNRLGVIDVFRSLIWTRKYYECGTFELHAPLNTRNLQLLAENNILSKQEFKDKNGHIVKTTSKESGIVEYIAIDDTVNEITAKGRFLPSIMDRRAIKTVVNFNGKTEAGMRKLVQSVTAMPFVELGELKGFTETVRFQVSYKELYTYMCKLSKYSNLGFTIRADFKAKKFFFEVYKGVDRTESQRERSRVVFSEIYKNLNGVAYVFSNQNTKTCAIVAGEGEGTARTLVTVGGGTGWDLREVIVDARDVQKDDDMTTAEYTEILKQKGNEKLAEYGIVEAMDAQTKPFVNFVYREDYDLGDVVTVKKKMWGIEMDKRITEIQEIFENGGFDIVPTFGDPLPETVNLDDN